VCDECGVWTAPTDEAAEWWLVGYDPATNIRTTRCPRHITVWTMRVAKLERSKANFRWKRLAAEYAKAHPPTGSLLTPFYYPDEAYEYDDLITRSKPDP